MTYQLDEWMILRQQLEHDEISPIECFDRCIELNRGKHANQPWNSREWKSKRKQIIGNNTCCQKCGIDTSIHNKDQDTCSSTTPPHQLFLLGM